MKSPASSSIQAPSRRRFLQSSLITGASAIAGGALLSACGSGDIVSELAPARFVVLGDGLSYLGDPRFTVNDGTTNIWAVQMAARFGLTLTAADGKAAGNAKVADIGTQVAAVGTPGAQDVFLVNAPMQDIFDGAASTTVAAAAGTALATHMRSLINAGAKYVLVAGLYDLGKSPAAIGLGQGAAYTAAALSFNTAFKTAAVDLGAHLLFVDTTYYINLVLTSPSTYGLNNIDTAVCTVSPATSCTTGTLRAGADHNTYLFADDRHFTPTVHRQFGNYAYDQIKTRW
jgi:outer membrane lipase/esterase